MRFVLIYVINNCYIESAPLVETSAKNEVGHIDNHGAADDDQVVKESERPSSPPLPPMNML